MRAVAALFQQFHLSHCSTAHQEKHQPMATHTAPLKPRPPSASDSSIGITATDQASCQVKDSHAKIQAWIGFKIRATAIAATLAMLSALCLPTSAMGADASSRSSPKTMKEPAKKKGGLKITHQRSASEETAAARDRRLTRECKGAPNAGACLGYARK